MYFVDWATGIQIDVRKPYFTLNDRDKTLQLHNFPVPKSGQFYIDNQKKLVFLNLFISDKIQKNKIFQKLLAKFRFNFPLWHRLLKRIHNLVFYRIFCNLGYRNNLLKADIEYGRSNSYGWRLMRALIERMISNAGSRPVIIIPIPLSAHVLYGATPHYLQRFKELTGENVHIVDILSAFKGLSREEKDGLYVPNGHFSPKGNQIIANCCESVFEKFAAGNEKRSTSNKIFKDNPSKYILGISCFYHDSAAALIREGHILAAAQEERFTRIKHDKSFPVNAIQYCLEEGRIDGKELNAVVYYDNEGLTFERMLATQLYLGERGRELWQNSISRWLDSKLP